ncbi:MAG: YceI family protein [Bacteroidota bacterium]
MRTLSILAAFRFLISFAACNNAPSGEKAATGEAVETAPAETTASAVTFAVNTNESKVNWIGAKLLGDQHSGFIKLREGALQVEGGQLVGGSFVIDMNSLENTDMNPGEGKEDLEGHLKNNDFFEVETYPTGKFEVTSLAAVEGREDATHTITGNLTLKDITKSITFPAKVSVSDASIEAVTPQFVIDRTQWNVMYGAGVLGLAKDKIIKDEVALQINLMAAPQQAAN